MDFFGIGDEDKDGEPSSKILKESPKQETEKVTTSSTDATATADPAGASDAASQSGRSTRRSRN